MLMRKQQKNTKEMEYKLTYCVVHLCLSLIMEHQRKVTGTMTGWCCSSKIALMS